MPLRFIKVIAMILDTLAQATRERVAKEKEVISPEEMSRRAEALPKGNFRFEKALKSSDISFICEVKKASPSKGIIVSDFPYLSIAEQYEKAGASAISVLTEPEYFKGDIRYLHEISQKVNIPLLRKDFTVDSYMIDQAHVYGASAVLLICSLLDTETLRKYIAHCDHLGLSALVEAHDEEEVQSALTAGARIIGVNNRNLKDFTVDIQNGIRLRKLVPQECIFVAESGIKTAADIQALRETNVNAVLIGETLMRTENKKQMLDCLRGSV